MKVRKLLSMIVTSAILVSTITVPTTNATTTLSVQKADSVFAADTEASPAITTTKITTMANVVKTTTTTTLPSITSTTSSHFSSVFKKVINYPEKTVYNKGEKLDIKGLLISATVNSNSFDDAAEKQYDESYFKIGNFTVIDKEGSAVSGNRFSTLPAGEYTVSHHGLIGDYYSYNGCNDVVFSYNVTIIDDSPNATKTNPVTTTITTTTTTTLTTTMVMPTTHKTYVFDKVLYYPEKTVYNTGEELNIKRLLIRATENPKNNPNNNTSRQYDESYFSISSFNVTDKNEKSVSGSKFNTLPAGDYTVSYDGTVGNYYDFNWCTNVKFS
ncbi:MAG: hypothetical protein J5723_07250, partial [Ruminococcus sp.]|nr:hypothetical protein [Ruminococcus sp.]